MTQKSQLHHLAADTYPALDTDYTAQARGTFDTLLHAERLGLLLNGWTDAQVAHLQAVNSYTITQWRYRYGYLRPNDDPHNLLSNSYYPKRALLSWVGQIRTYDLDAYRALALELADDFPTLAPDLERMWHHPPREPCSWVPTPTEPLLTDPNPQEA